MRNLCLLALVLCSTHVAAFVRFGGWGRAGPSEEPKVPMAAVPAFDLASEVPRDVTTASSALMTEYRDRQGFSACWNDAVAAIDHTCGKALTDQQTRSRLALDFTNCQLTGDGKASLSVDCPANYETQRCIARLDEKIYPVYLQFRLHVDTLCFHVQQELFQRRASQSAAALRNAAGEASRKISDISERAQQHVDTMQVLASHQESAAQSTEKAVDQLSRLAKAHESFASDLRDKQSTLRSIGETVDIISERQGNLVLGLREVASNADALSAKQVEAIERIGLSADGIRKGVVETMATTATLMRDQKALSAELSSVSRFVKDVHDAQDVALEKANSVSARMETISRIAESGYTQQLRFLDVLRSETQAVSRIASEQQRDVISTTTNILSTLAQLHSTVAYISEVALSIESLVYYCGMASAVILLTMAPALAPARFVALLVGPVACFTVEKWFLKEALVMLHFCGLVADPWASMVGGIDFLPAVTALHLRVVRQCFALVTAAVLLRSALQYESPEVVHRRLVADAVREALADAFDEGGVATRYFVAKSGLVPKRLASEPRPTTEARSLMRDMVESRS